MKMKFLISSMTISLLLVGCSSQNEDVSKTINNTEEQVTTTQENGDTNQTEAKENTTKVVEEDYTKESYMVYKKAVEAEKEVKADEKATKKEIATVEKAVDEAKKSLEKKVKEEDYTRASYTVYEKAVENEKEIKADKKATKKEIVTAEKAVDEAKETLEKKLLDVDTVTITAATALAANDLARSLEAFEYTVEGTIPSAHKDSVKQVTVTFTKGDDKKDIAVEVEQNGTFTYVIPADQFAIWTKVKVSYDYKGKTQESEIKTLTPKVKPQ